MRSTHQLLHCNALDTPASYDGKVSLIVTSPPYPMVSMWDELFANSSKQVAEALEKGDGREAFESMHVQLDPIWARCVSLLHDGGIACINIGDATRTLNERFELYSNHARIIHSMQQLGMQCLPLILWRKSTNAPNKFMGSGMLAPGAYVTLEHEYILVFRKGDKRIFDAADKERRKRSAYFWEERNRWFSDLWALGGTRQVLTKGLDRARSAAYPIEVPYRLIQMYSLQGDLIYDPFLGTGTSSIAAMLSGRNSLGTELSADLVEVCREQFNTLAPATGHTLTQKRLAAHKAFVNERQQTRGEGSFKHHHPEYDFPVMTRQETTLHLPIITSIEATDHHSWQVDYERIPDSVQLKDAP